MEKNYMMIKNEVASRIGIAFFNEALYHTKSEFSWK
jgi:hypothetical protein